MRSQEVKSQNLNEEFSKVWKFFEERSFLYFDNNSIIKLKLEPFLNAYVIWLQNGTRRKRVNAQS